MSATQQVSHSDAGRGGSPVSAASSVLPNAPAGSGGKKVRSAQSDAKKVGLIGLTAIVISAMVGGGIYDLPQNMAASASAGGQIIAWIITGIGMWFIANTFRILADVKPNLKNGIYTYAERGFGKFVGFLIAYGYWVCNCVSLVAYGVLIMSTMNYFFPGVFTGGNNIPAIIGASVVTWAMFWLACRGIKSGAVFNVVGTIGKILPVLVFIVALITVFQFSVFMDGFWGYAKDGVDLSFNFGDVMKQVSGTMAITLFLFTGIEGAVVVSGDASSQKDVSKATTIGYLSVLLLYAVVSLLPLGLYSSTEIAGMSDPSMAAIMEHKFGGWGALVVNIGVIISVISSWLVWLLMLAQMPLYAARDGIFPRQFTKTNAHGAPVRSLLWSTIVIQVVLVLCHFTTGNAWNTIVTISAVMCMPCYLMCSAFLWKVAATQQWPKNSRFSKKNGLITGIMGTLFGAYLIYSSGLNYVMIAVFMYAIGIPLFIVGRRQAGQTGNVLSYFTRCEKIICAAVLVLGVVGLIYAIGSGLFS